MYFKYTTGISTGKVEIRNYPQVRKPAGSCALLDLLRLKEGVLIFNYSKNSYLLSCAKVVILVNMLITAEQDRKVRSDSVNITKAVQIPKCNHFICAPGKGAYFYFLFNGY